MLTASALTLGAILASSAVNAANAASGQPDHVTLDLWRGWRGAG